MFVSFFFFQAEDGIRDYKVTGVQTCALPISQEAGRRRRAAPAAGPPRGDPGARRGTRPLGAPRPVLRPRQGDRESVVLGKRVELGGRRIIKKKKKKF